MLIDCKQDGLNWDQMFDMWDDGFRMPISDVVRMLDVSKQWVKENIMPQINCVKYTTSFLIAVEEDGCNQNVKRMKRDVDNPMGIHYSGDKTRFRRSDIYDWLCSNAIFTRQTYVADWLVYAGITESRYNADMDRLKDMRLALVKAGKLPTEEAVVTFDDYLQAYYPDVLSKQIRCRKRSLYPARTVTMTPEELDRYTIKPTSESSKGTSMELIYRQAILDGAIRCQIGMAQPYAGQKRPRSKKTLLLHPKAEVKYPIVRPVGDTSYKTLKAFWAREIIPYRCGKK